MKRRDFLKAVVGVVISGGTVPEALADITLLALNRTPEKQDSYIKDYLYKMRNFDVPHLGDICLDQQELKLLKSCVGRFRRLQRTVGHGNFYLLSFDEAIGVACNYSRVGQFPKDELDFLEKIFYADASAYGFLGEKPLKNLTYRVQRRQVVKVPYTGNFLYRGSPTETYDGIKRDVGHGVILTSGVRSVIKQFLLFLDKTYRSKGNLSLASRSLAPPGYSYHGIGDFDVGQIGFGPDNFTERFTGTLIYSRLKDLGYINIRYQRNNLLGVRFEPWHIKVN